MGEATGVSVQDVVAGLAVGSIYALVALGLTLIYGVLRLIHVAHAGVYTLGAYVGFLVSAVGYPLPAGLLAAMIVGALGGMAMERLVYRPLLAQPPLVPLIASIGLFILLEDLFRVVFGPQIQAFAPGAQAATVRWGSVTLAVPQLVIAVVALALLALASWILGKTRVGLAWRALAQDMEIAQALGMPLPRLVSLAFALASALGAAAGVLVAWSYNEVYPTMGSVPAYKALAVVVLGGLGNALGTMLAGLLLGVVESLVVARVGYLLPRDAIAFVALVLVLLVRPSGLFTRGGS